MLSSRGHIKANLKPTALYCNALHTSDRAGSLQLLLYAWNFYGHNVNSFHRLLFTLAKNNFMEAIGDEWQTKIKYRVPEVRLESESFRTFRPWILPYTNFQVNIWSTAVSAVSVVTVGIGQTLRGVLETAIIAANNIDSFTPLSTEALTITMHGQFLFLWCLRRALKLQMISNMEVIVLFLTKTVLFVISQIISSTSLKWQKTQTEQRTDVFLYIFKCQYFVCKNRFLEAGR